MGLVVRNGTGGHPELVPQKSAVQEGVSSEAVEDLLGNVSVADVPSGFAEHHAMAASRRQAVRKHRSGSSSPDDDSIVVHGSSGRRSLLFARAKEGRA
jgi:hypothetical protein